jgi:hypothetical protein
MANYQGVSSSYYDEPEYRNIYELEAGQYCIICRDIVGVVPTNESIVARKCRMKPFRWRAAIDYFESINKLIIGKNRGHIWWVSGIYHSLYKGKYSPTQLQSVQKRLKAWSNCSVFGSNFAQTVAQVYVRKYSLVIPYPKPIRIESESESESESDVQSEASLRDPQKKIKFNKQLFDYGWREFIRSVNIKHYEILRNEYKNCLEWYLSSKRNKSFPASLDAYIQAIERWVFEDTNLRRKLQR